MMKESTAQNSRIFNYRYNIYMIQWPDNTKRAV